MELYSRKERLEHLESWRKQRISGKEYCRQHGIKPTTFYSWIKLEKNRSDKSGQSQKLIPVFRSLPANKASSVITLEFQGITLRIPSHEIRKILPDILHCVQAVR